jgi:hypothetical protein
MKNLLFPLVLALLAPGRAALAQTQPTTTSRHLITGTVRDERSADGLPRVRVSVKGDTAQATTDAKGQFQLRVAAPAPIMLQVERNGYVSQEIPLTAETNPVVKVWLARPAVEWTARSGWAEARRIQRQNRRAAQAALPEPVPQATSSK